MEIISRSLFGIANSLLIPDVVLLIVFFFRALILAGGTYNSFMVRRKNAKVFEEKIKSLTPAGLAELRRLVPANHNSAFTRYLADILANNDSEDYSDYILTRYETEVQKDVNISRLLTKLGPVLGLVGTLISMSPALVGLSTGDISGMAYNMQVVFAATVVGLVISAVGLSTCQLKQRWYAADVNNLDRVCRVINSAGCPADSAKTKSKEEQA